MSVDAAAMTAQGPWAIELLAHGPWTAAIRRRSCRGSANGWHSERFGWGQRLGLPARCCADLDVPDALAMVLGAVDSLPLNDGEVRAARGVVLRNCAFADCRSW